MGGVKCKSTMLEREQAGSTRNFLDFFMGLFVFKEAVIFDGYKLINYFSRETLYKSIIYDKERKE